MTKDVMAQGWLSTFCPSFGYGSPKAGEPGLTGFRVPPNPRLDYASDVSTGY